jgi:tetratricopeptide (TPR) repeat protein
MPEDAASNARLADEKVALALESKGKERTELANQALALDVDCVDAYMLLATSESNDADTAIAFYKQAVEAAKNNLPKNYEKKYDGRFWKARETRPLMQAMASLAMALQMNDELEEALTLYRKLMKLNPEDNLGIRYQFAGCLFEANCDEELEKHLIDHGDDHSAALLYTRALLLFRRHGANNLATQALLKAYQANFYVPLFLSDVVEMPDEPPMSIGYGDDSEAIAYVMDSDYMWAGTPGAMSWMADMLEAPLRAEYKDKELIDAALEQLRTSGA